MSARLRFAGAVTVAALAALLTYATIAAGFTTPPTTSQLEWAALAAALGGGFA